MSDRTANLLGTVSLAIAESMQANAREILNHAGETAAALVVIGYGTGPSNEQLRTILGLSHPGAVRLIDKLVAEGLAKRRQGADKRAIALHLTQRGKAMRERILAGRLSTVGGFLSGLTEAEQGELGGLLHKLLASLETSDAERCSLCRLCDDRVCTDCPIPAAFKQDAA